MELTVSFKPNIHSCLNSIRNAINIEFYCSTDVHVINPIHNVMTILCAFRINNESITFIHFRYILKFALALAANSVRQMSEFGNCFSSNWTTLDKILEESNVCITLKLLFVHPIKTRSIYISKCKKKANPFTQKRIEYLIYTVYLFWVLWFFQSFYFSTIFTLFSSISFIKGEIDKKKNC